MTSQEIAPRQDSAPAAIPEALLERVQEAVASIPGDDGSGAARIVEQLLNATDIDALNAPWESTSGRDLAGKTLRIESISQRPSSFGEGPGIFLVAEGADMRTGEKVTFTTSAVSVVIQLAQAWRLGLFPITAEIVVAERPTEKGFYPYHLKVIGAGRGGQS